MMNKLTKTDKQVNYIKSNIDQIVNNIPRGNFNFIFHPLSVKYLSDAYNAVDLTSGGWNFMREESPPNNKGYMRWNNEVIKRIETNMVYINEIKLGTFGSVMREIEDIAITGWENYIRMRINYILNEEKANRDLYINNMLNLMGVNNMED